MKSMGSGGSKNAIYGGPGAKQEMEKDISLTSLPIISFFNNIIVNLERS